MKKILIALVMGLALSGCVTYTPCEKEALAKTDKSSTNTWFQKDYEANLNKCLKAG